MPDLPCDQDLFDLLVCPIAKTPLKYVDGMLVSTDRATRRAYKIADGIPIMLVEESEVLDLPRWESAMAGDGPRGGGVQAVQERHAKRPR